MLSLVTPVHRPSIFSSKSVERSRHKNRGGFIDRQHKGVGVGEEDRHLWEQLKLAFPGKSKLPWAERRLSFHHHVNDSSYSRPASKSVCHRLDALTYYCNLYTDVVLFFFSLSSKTSVSAESEKEKWRTSVDIFGKKEVYFKVPLPCQRLIIITYACAVPIKLNQWYWRSKLLSILEHFKNDTRTRVFV